MYQTNRDSGRNTTAMILIGLGVLFLVAQTFRVDFFGTLWPFVVMLPGLAFLYAAVSGNKDKAGLAVPGAVITGTGVILLYQNITNHWESWAYIWSLYPVFVGLALTYIGRRTESAGQLKAGQGLIRWGLTAFVILWVVFELLIFRGGSVFGSYLLPMVLIGAGLYLMLRRNTPEKVKVVYTDTEKPKTTNGRRPTPSEDLQAKIDAALAEPDEPHQN